VDPKRRTVSVTRRDGEMKVYHLNYARIL
jgi:hypothetical protein